jgi:LAO/AO transport system kinase
MKQPDAKTCIDGVLAGDRRMLAKAITLVESALPAHRETARKILGALLPKTGGAVRLGITGVPGVGKSTFIESFGMMLLEKGHRVAVLAVDPSSARSGGSLMADKTRMERLSADRRAFIRPSPSGGTLGGVARKTRETMLVCEAAGYDVIVVETVGVGQSETTVASMVDFFLVLMLAGAGDDLQGMKRGILELADALAINKADGENRARAERARMEYASALHLFPLGPDGWAPPVLTCSALTGEGLPAIWNAVLEHRARQSASGSLARQRQRQSLAWMRELLLEGLHQIIQTTPEIGGRLPALEQAVTEGRTTPFAAARELLELVRGHRHGAQFP